MEDHRAHFFPGEKIQGLKALPNPMIFQMVELTRAKGLQRASKYLSIQINYRQTFFLGENNSNYRYRIVLPEELISITQTNLWKSPQKVSHWRYRFFLDI